MTHFKVCRKPFYEQNAKTEKCAWAAYTWVDCIWAYPKERSMQPKINGKTNMCETCYFLLKILTKIHKVASKRCPNGWINLEGGAPTTFGTPIYFLIWKMHPKCSQSDPNVPKLIKKVMPKC